MAYSNQHDMSYPILRASPASPFWKADSYCVVLLWDEDNYVPKNKVQIALEVHVEEKRICRCQSRGLTVGDA